jgi:4-hydroxyproline epimerase
MIQAIRTIDSHTGGEPTRVVIQGGPELGDGTLADRRGIFQRQYDQYRSAVVNEPRGSDVLVGALLCHPSSANCLAGVIFFNNVGYLGMCGHGLIGLMETLRYLGRVQPGEHQIETPVGIVGAILHEDGSVSVRNVDCFRAAKDVALDVPDIGTVVGDVAYGGNWFFLVKDHQLDLHPANLDGLSEFCWRTRLAANQQGFPEVDHVELFGAPELAISNSRNFVLCPGKAYDRSPCGTGTSAKLACLAVDGELEEGERWVQEGILDTTFTGSFRWLDRQQGMIAPTITGRAYITAEVLLLLDDADPFRWGVSRI